MDVAGLPDSILQRIFSFVDLRPKKGVCAIVARSWRLLAHLTNPHTHAAAHPTTIAAAARDPVAGALHEMLDPPVNPADLPWLAALLPNGSNPLHDILGQAVAALQPLHLEQDTVAGSESPLALLPDDLVVRAFDFLDETWKMKAAMVGRRWHAASMELVLSSVLTPILWAVPPHAVRHICDNLPAHDLGQVACVCQQWLELSKTMKVPCQA